MKSVNIRGVEEPMWRRWRSESGRQGMNLKDWVIWVLEGQFHGQGTAGSSSEKDYGGSRGKASGGVVGDAVPSGGVQVDSKGADKRRDSESLGPAPRREASSDAGTVVRSGKKDRGKPAKAGVMSREEYSKLSKSEALRAMREGKAPRGF